MAPTPGEKPILELPDLGWSFLHAVPPIGTKFALPDVLGPQSQPAQFTSPIEGQLKSYVLGIPIARPAIRRPVLASHLSEYYDQNPASELKRR